MAESLSGKLFIYNTSSRLCAFHSGSLQSNKIVIFVGGLTEGFMSLPWLPTFSQQLEQLELSLVQALLTSSYRGFGITSLKQDAQELNQLLASLREDSQQSLQFILMGHSTGCQSILTLLHELEAKNLNGRVDDIAGVILHGGISDRDYAQQDWPDYYQLVMESTSQLDCSNEDPLRNTMVYSKLRNGTAYTFYRLKSLLAPHGDDDFFSFDLSTEYLVNRLSVLTMPTLVLFNGADEYVPNVAVYEKLHQVYKNCCPDLHYTIIKDSNHGVSDPYHQKVLLMAIRNFIAKLFNLKIPITSEEF